MVSPNANQIKEKIIYSLSSNGPQLPIQIAKQLNMSTLFTSAFLSELISEEKVKSSFMKIGSSYIYYLKGQEFQLEKWAIEYLKNREKEAFLNLKEKKFINDSELEPALSVAIRNLKDFAIPFKEENKLFWRYFKINENEFNKLSKNSLIIEEETTTQIKENKQEQNSFEKEKQNPQENSSEKEIINQIKSEEETKTLKNQFLNPLVIKNETKTEKSKFFIEIEEIIRSKNFKIIQEKENKKNEITLLVQINSDLGPINFFTIAKNKKTISESEITQILSESQKIPLPALLITPAKITKKNQELIQRYSSILKVINI